MAKKEFNLPELVTGISNQTQIGEHTIGQVLDNVRKLCANFLANDKDKRIELNGLFIIEMKKVPARPWKTNGKFGGPTEGITPAHFKVVIKPHKGFIDAINDNLPADAPLKAMLSEEKRKKS